MFAKLFSRITESSLMEEPINVRYTFVMLLAISDPKGYVIGTDIAIARRLNMKISEFRECLDILMAPDPDSNSQEHEGRRVLVSDVERGYKLVNYMTYRDMKSTENRRNYMREYMRAKRREDQAIGENVKKGANTVKIVAPLKQEEADSEAKTEEPIQPASAGEFWDDPLPPMPKPNKARGTLDDLQAFAVEIGLPASDGEAMFYRLEADGWKRGTQPLKCWRSHMRNYKSRGIHPSQQTKTYGTTKNHRAFTQSPCNTSINAKAADKY